ncbi:MAG TPA: Ada metal-binding domain-containing protein, partial [Sphingomonadales bacterium]|nr:Ada metal-binding domain-containing protein [Sphingomonadales bacterium]
IHLMTATAQQMYDALMRRDPHYDGKFFACVKTTGIYCRPVCPAPKPKPENCIFAASALIAERMGFRACKRCRPEAAPGSPAWAGTKASVSRALRLLSEEAAETVSLKALAGRLGMGERHLRRLFRMHIGASPKSVLQTRRLNLASQLLTETPLPAARVAFAAGFGSVRRFNDSFRRAFGLSPMRYRKKRLAQRRISA